MIRVNLLSGAKKEPLVAAGRRGMSNRLPTNVLPVLWAVVILGTAAYGYFWWSGLVTQRDNLAVEITSAQQRLASLQSVIDENAVFETRREMLADRIRTIDALRTEQVSPVVLLDRLSQAITRTDYVWLEQFSQNDTTITMAGVGTSVNALADFVSSLEETGYFRNINLVNAQDTDGNFSFQMICDFVPPSLPRVAVGDTGGADAQVPVGGAE